MIAVVPVRAAVLPAGADETVAEAGGRALVVGDDTRTAAAGLTACLTEVQLAELGPFAPARWAASLAPVLAPEDLVLLPASADGRDLAPRLAHALARPLLAGAVAASPGRVVVARQNGRVAEDHAVTTPAVATLLPGVRGVEARPPGYRPPEPVAAAIVAAPGDRRPGAGAGVPSSPDPEVLEVTPPDPATMDLAEAPFIVAGGAGLGSAGAAATLARVATALGASLGATRVVTDAGWVPFERQIGTTGVAVDPRVYVAFGISGAVQHTSGLGAPDHVLAVNLDPSCPMMAMADVAIVADAPAVVAELAARLGERPGA